MFTHIVLFWLKPEAPKDAQQRLLSDCAEYLGKIPNVRKLTIGKPAMTPRPVVDNSYQVGICVVLDDAAGHDAYQVHPLHNEFLSRNKDNWQRVQVYDFA